MPAHPNSTIDRVIRVAVVYVLRGEAAEVGNRLRGQFDPRSADAIPAHLTLAGPVNLRVPVKELLPVFETIARDERAFDVRVEGAGTFLPISPTAFLEVSPQAPVRALHDRLLAGLGWQEAYPYHPHVTIAEYRTPEETAAIYAELEGRAVRLSGRLDCLTLFEKRADGCWEVRAEFELRDGVSST